MNQLTPFESALLDQFRRLASAFDQSQAASADMQTQLERWSRVISNRQSEIEERLDAIEETQRRLSEALNTHNSSTTTLVTQVNRLLDAHAK